MKNQKQNNSRLPMTSTPAKLSRASLAITAGRLLASDAAYQRCGDISITAPQA
jgi:hypothetical protein